MNGNIVNELELQEVCRVSFGHREIVEAVSLIRDDDAGRSPIQRVTRVFVRKCRLGHVKPETSGSVAGRGKCRTVLRDGLSDAGIL